jgi:hypothetical protein
MEFRIAFSTLLSAIVATVFFSCASPLAMHKSFVKTKGSLSYIHDSEPRLDSAYECVTVIPPSLDAWQLTGPGMVRKKSAWVVPLIFINVWKSEYEYFPGRDGISEDVPAFIQNSVITEANRSAAFRASADGCASDLTLEIEVDSTAAKGAYVTQGFIYYFGIVYGTSTSESAGIGEAYSRFHYRLKKGDEVLFSGESSSRQVSQPLARQYGSKNELRSFFNRNLLEALALSFKTNVDILVEDVDRFFDERRVVDDSVKDVNPLGTND